jgi:hypothetical protein
MAAWRTLASAVVALAWATTTQAQTYDLTEAPPADGTTRVQVKMILEGKVKVFQEGQAVTLNQAATASHEFVERVKKAGPDGLPVTAARLYQTARVSIRVGEDKTERTIRPERSLIVAQRSKDTLIAYCPKGALTREELETIDHIDTMSIPGLLPGKKVNAGETWKVTNSVAQCLCHFDGLTEQDLTCKLESVTGNVAYVTFGGTATGIDLGASIKLTVRGNYRFDQASRRLTQFQWEQKEERDQGPASPGSQGEVTFGVTRTVTDSVPGLSDIALAVAPLDQDPPPARVTNLEHRDAKGRYELTHARDWTLVANDGPFLILRLMNRGEFVAQATIRPWKKADAGTHVAPDDFRAEMQAAPNWEQEKELSAEELKADAKGYWIYRVCSQGQLNDLEVMQYFYLVAGPSGEQVLITFTITPSQASKLESRDLDLVRGLTLPSGTQAPTVSNK